MNRGIEKVVNVYLLDIAGRHVLTWCSSETQSCDYEN